MFSRGDKKIKDQDPFIIQEGNFKYGELDGFSYRLGWAEDSMIMDKGQKEIVGRSFNFEKIKIIFLFIFIFLSILFGRIYYLQVLKGDYYQMMAEGNRIRTQRVEAKRGVVYDRNGNPLVRNIANFMLYFLPADLPRDNDEKQEIFSKISEILGDISVEELNEILSEVEIGSLESFRPLFIVDNIEYEKAMILYMEADNMPGVILDNKTRREYNLYSMSLSHVLGYTGKINQKELEDFGEEYLPIDYIGKTGIEYFWENELKGINGKKRVEVDALGKEKKIINIENADDGHNLVLALDINLQKKIEEVLIEKLENIDASRASVIVMNPQNGEVLSLVSFPAYNNNVFARGIAQDEYNVLLNHPDRPLFNRSVSGEYPSGSTFKPVILSVALEEKVVSENTSFLSTGGIRVGQWFFPDWRAGGHGLTDARKAIAQSVNTYFYYIGGGYDDFVGLGVDRIVNGAKLFGLGEQTGIDLAGEANGFLPSKEWKEKTKGEIWYIGDTYHLAIGQGDILVTPLQVANFTSVFANGGKLYRPHLVKDVLSSDNDLIFNVENFPIRSDFLDDYNVAVVRQGMRQAVTSGSAVRLSTLPVTSAGKTGTAQWSTQKETHAWFTGFAPYEDPEVAITILVEEGGEGSSTAVPIAHDILNWYFGEYKKSE